MMEASLDTVHTLPLAVFPFSFLKAGHIASFKLVFISKHKLEHELHICLPTWSFPS